MSDKPFPLRTVLFVSVALNLLVLGGIIGVAVSGARLHGPERGPILAPRAFMGALPPEKEMKIRASLEEAWRASSAERLEAREARQALLNAVEQDKLDPNAIRAALSNLRAADEKLAAKNQEAVIGVLQDLSPGERAAALQAFLRPRMMGGMPQGPLDRDGPAPPPGVGEPPPPH